MEGQIDDQCFFWVRLWENVGRDCVRHCVYVQTYVLRATCKPTTHGGTRYICFSPKPCCQESHPWSDQLSFCCGDLLYSKSLLSASACAFLCLMQLVLLWKPPHVARSFCIIRLSLSPSVTKSRLSLNFGAFLVFHGSQIRKCLPRRATFSWYPAHKFCM